MNFVNLRVAIVHDQLMEFGGAERVLVELCKIFPQAKIYTSFCTPKSLGIHWEKFKDKEIITYKYAKFPFLRRFISPLRFLFPKIWESFDFSDFDLVLSSSGGWSSHGVITPKNCLHICYLHTPPRYLYGYETALEWRKYTLIRWYGNLINHFLRLWDFQAGQRPNFFIANSLEVQKRINRFYARESIVIYPPVKLSQSNLFMQNIDPKKSWQEQSSKSYYLTVSRLAGAKHIEVQIEAAKIAKYNLKIVGTGRSLQNLQKIASSNVEFLSHIPDSEFEKIFANAKAFLNTAVDEEFGISAVEALGRGVPVICYGQAGLLETVQDNLNGLHFKSNKPSVLVNKIQEYEAMSLNQIEKLSESAFVSAQRFSKDKFAQAVISFVKEKLDHARAT